MLDKFVHVVGDKFAGFRNNNRVITLMEFEHIVETDGKNVNPGTVFVAGQGLQQKRVAAILKKLSESKSSSCVNFRQSSLKKADSWMTHKHHAENIMISEPNRIDSTNFCAQIVLDDLCAEMSDHMTGQHIQGLVLLEAARQMFIAVTSNYFLEEKHKKNSYFVLSHMDIDYKSFVFPLQIELLYEIKDQTIDKHGNMTFDVCMKIMQLTNILIEVNITFSVYKNIFMRMIEASRASNILDSYEEIQQQGINVALLPQYVSS